MLLKRKDNKRLKISKITGERTNLTVNAGLPVVGRDEASRKQYATIWSLTNAGISENDVDVEKAWDTLQQRIAQHESMEYRFVEHGIRRSNNRLIPVMIRVAAVLIVALSGYFLLKTMAPEKTITLTAQATKTEPLLLPDGSMVYMKQGASITYPKQFNSSERKVSFEGEAFFEVAKDPSKPFRIIAGPVGVEVLGTSFNLNACRNNEKVVLSLHSGKVLFYSIDPATKAIGESIELLPGQSGIYTCSSGRLSSDMIKGTNHLAWKTGVLEFSNSPLSEVFGVLAENYGVRFVNLKPEDQQLRLTATFDNEPLDRVLETLSLIYGFNTDHQQNEVIFK